MDTQQFIEEHLHDDVRELALGPRNAKVDMTLALRQIEARQLLRKKVPSWSQNPLLLFPSHLSIEQCSSEATALYKASLTQGTTFADLTGGLGVDCFFISQNFQHSDYVEVDPELCALARHNLNGPIIHNESAEAYLNHCEPADWMLVDPSRRDQYGRKTVSVGDCTPNVVELQEQLLRKTRHLMVKLSPMLDISQALKELRHVKEIHVVAVANECKELLFLLEPGFEGIADITCVHIESGQPSVRFTLEDERRAGLQLALEVGHYLYEPNAAVMKGGCYRLLTERYAVRKLHRNSHLYTSDTLVADFPGRVFEVDDWAVYGKKAKAMLGDLDRASVAVRNFPMRVAELRKRHNIGDGDQVYLFATTLSDERKVVVKTHKASTRDPQE